ncbi:hypothetical protein [Methylobacterium haplocladii]|uniref:Uncharacterized protein n=1 Tax=Methylobacterium haplocladii TaxID=1176176 RepID=A0A512IQJ3_9HYPH|nr:hypothetical protein [Methylobacterium haplocladii]GEO99991.1 hypothetical protein MHA02_23790 [Methylobacterium haplocladii]GLS60079.1 hypothetical protein GCM10007887_27560 [Methylobacterium haplocladii]
MAELKNKKSFLAYFESWSPFVLAATAFCTLIFFRVEITQDFVTYKLSLPQLYTAIFGWASVMTGFQFGVYSLIFSKTDGFISRISSTKALEKFMSYTKRAVTLGFALTIFGIPLLIINADMDGLSVIMYCIGTLYVSLFIYSFAATVRVAKLFAIMAKIKTKISLPA